MNLQIKTFTCDFLSLLFPRNNLTFFLLSLVAPETAGVWEKSHFSFAFLSPPFQHDYDEEKKNGTRFKNRQKKVRKSCDDVLVKESFVVYTCRSPRGKSEDDANNIWTHFSRDKKEPFRWSLCWKKISVTEKASTTTRAIFFGALFTLSSKATQWAKRTCYSGERKKKSIKTTS